MNLQHWEEELEIFEKDCVIEEKDEPIIHLWQSEKDNIVFVIKEGYKIKQWDDGYGRKGYVIEKKNEEVK